MPFFSFNNKDEPISQHHLNNESTNPPNAFPTHNINNSNSSNHSQNQPKTNGYHEQSNVNSNSNKNADKNHTEDNDVEAELEDLKRFERATKDEMNGNANNHNHVFDPEQLAALHQHHHHNHNGQQTLVPKSNHIHEAAFATHSKPLNGKGTRQL